MGAAFGLVHAIYTYCQVVFESSIVATGNGAAVPLRACYFALWTFGLWILFGCSIIALWAISVLAYGISGLLEWRM